jgi:PAS domain S-box-containing protein
MLPPGPSYAWTLLLSAALSATVGVAVLLSLQEYPRRVQASFAAVAFAGATWTAGYALLYTTGGSIGAVVSVAGLLAVPPLWLVFVLTYTGDGDLLRPSRGWLLAVEPALVMAELLASGLPWSALRSTRRFVHLALDVETPLGPLLTAHAVYSALLAAVSVAALVMSRRDVESVDRSRQVLLSGATALPPAAFIAGPVTADVVGTHVLDPSPLFFGLSTSLAFLALGGTQLRTDGVLPPGSTGDVGQVAVDADGRVLVADPAARRLLGADPGAEGQRLEALLPPGQDVPREPGERTEVAVNRDGRHQFVTVRVESSRADGLDDGDDCDLVVVRPPLERDAQPLVEHAREIVSVRGADGTWVYLSPSVSEHLGYDPEAVEGEDSHEFFHPDDRTRMEQLFESVAATGDAARTRVRVRHANGSWRRHDVVVEPLAGDPSDERLVVTARDVTVQDRHEQRLEVLNRVLRHDLRNGMNVVLGNADLLLESELPPDAVRRIRTIRRRALSLVDLGERFRRVDEAMSDTSGIRQSVDVVAVVERVIERQRDLHPEAKFSLDCPSEASVLADDLIEVALANVVENAVVHHDRDAPHVRVTVERTRRDDRPVVLVSVTDDGPGLDESQRAVLEHGTETPLKHTDGLGLWLVRWIVEESAGLLQFAGNEPRGTVVEIALEPADSDSQ